MTHSNQPRRTGRSLVAWIAGAATGILLSIGTDMVMHSTGIFPPFGQPMSDSLFVLATAYRTAYGVLGSYIVARLAPYRPMWHAMVLGVVGVIVSAIGAAVTWNKGPEFGPHWYPISLVVLALPQSWLGARLREIQLNP